MTITRYRSSHAPGIVAAARSRRRDAGEGAPRPDDLPDVGEDVGIGFVPESWNPETREIDVVLSTGADVRRYDWWTDREFTERLSLDPTHANLARLNGNAPWLRVHNARDLDAVLGLILPGTVRIDGTDARHAGGENTARMLGRVRLSDTPGDAEVVRKIATGLIRGVSIGYDVEEETITAATGDRIETRTATAWTAFEGSSVPIGADAGAGTRSRVESTPIPIPQPPAPPARMEPAMEKIRMVRKADETAADFETRVAHAKAAHGADNVTTDAAGTVDEGTIRAAAVSAERERVKGIRQAGRATGADDATIAAMIDNGVELDAARTALINAGAARDAANRTSGHQPATVTDDALDKRKRGIANAILHRARPESNKLDDEGRHWRGLSLLEMARECLTADGINVRGMGPGQLAEEALKRRDFNSTSDFPHILASIPNKSLRKAYGEAPGTYTQIATRATLKDFRAKYGVQIGAGPALEKVNENGEFKRGSIVDGAESYGLETFGKIIGIGRRVLINDDLDVFAKLPAKMAAAAKRLENLLTWGVVLDNGNLSDGKAIFHADHANLIDVGAGGHFNTIAAGVAQVAAMRTLMRMALDLDGATRLGLTLRKVAVPDALLTEAERFFGGVDSSNTLAESVPKSMRNLVLISDPVLDDVSLKEWYGFADPSEIDGVEYAFLEGEEGPSIDTQVSFESDGMELRIRHDFGVGCMDYRGIVKNAGE
jgi:hypothetical protein